MTTVACITAFCCQVDDPRPAPPHPSARPLVAACRRAPGDPTGPHRWGEPRLLPLADASLSGLVAAAPRAAAALAPLQPPAGLAPDLPGAADGARRPRHGWPGGAPPRPRGPASPTARPPGPVASPRDGRGPTVSRAAPVGVGSGVGVGHRHGRGAPLAGAQAALGRAPAHLERDRLPGPRGGSRPAHTGSARCGAGPPACGNGVLEVDAEPSRHAGQAPGVGVLPRPPRVHDGGLQGAGPVAWLPAHQGRCRTPLDG